MSPREVPSLRFGVRAFVFILPLLAEVAFGGAACTSSKFANGESCLKDEDCASGICSQLVCAAAPPLTNVEADASPQPSEAAASDGAGDVAPETAPVEAAAESGPESGAD
jgi:hypothetical protein